MWAAILLACAHRGRLRMHPGVAVCLLATCPDIHEAAVIGRPDDDLGEVPLACVVPVPGRPLTPELVIGLVKNRLAAYKHARGADPPREAALPRHR